MISNSLIAPHEHESVHFYSNPKAGLEAVIAVHTTFSGVSLGGCRMNAYSSPKKALEDVLKLSEHMTYKSLMAGLNIGGGKSVILIKKNAKKTPELLQAFSTVVNSLGGRYVVSVDMGSDVEDMEILRKNCRWVIGYSDKEGGAGDPGVYTAKGVLSSMKAYAEEQWGSPCLKGKKICISGLGNVGLPLAKMLIDEEALITAGDIDIKKAQTVKNFNPAQVEIIDPKKAHTAPCDIFSPCALGEVFTEETVLELKCGGIAGAANNQLSSNEAGKMLHQRGILYLPDFVVNAGGLIGVVLRGLRKQPQEEVNKKVEQIGLLTRTIIEKARKQNRPTSEVALNMAKNRYKKTYSKTKVQ